TCEIELKCGNSLLANDDTLFELAREVAGEVVGADNVRTRDVAVMGGDDFAEFSVRIPGMYYFIGMADPEKGTDVPNHNTKFKLNEDALVTGMEMQMKLITRFMDS
ncbi:MAG: amidohydrolase, partial [Clostridiales bacterium]|nr:amidohydrolase [Clostridiales bacterium]